MKIVRTDSTNLEFAELVKKLDAYLKITDGNEHDFYNQFNNIDVLKNVIVVYENDVAVGCGAIKFYDNHTMEIKQMYVDNNFRKKGFAQQIIKELEHWAKELGFKKCILETGKRQVEAVYFYEKVGYNIIQNYGQYKGMKNSVCFEKLL